MNEQELETLIQKMPIGTPVQYFPVISDKTNFVETVTRSLPWMEDNGIVVVMIKGKSGYVAVRNIRFMPVVDPLLAEAKGVVLEMGKVSVGSIQRKMRIGYTRAAKLIDLMCEDGFLMRNEEGIPVLVTIQTPAPSALAGTSPIFKSENGGGSAGDVEVRDGGA